MIDFCGCFPGAFSPDSLNQYCQAITNDYNDWHPVLHTLIFIKLPLIISGGWIGSIILFQIIIFSLTLSYSLSKVYKYSNLKITVVIMLLAVFNPETLNILMFPWKDVAFAICALLLTTFLLEICFLKEKWFGKSLNTILFILIALLTLFFRHNAVLFVLPYLFVIFFLINKKRALIMILIIIILFGGVKLLIFTLFDVEKPNGRNVEILGLPMTIIGYVVKNNSEKLDNEIIQFVYQVSPKETWENHLVNGYNSVKWNSNTNNGIIEEYGSNKVLHIMFKCIKLDPVNSIRGFIELTNGLYSILNDQKNSFDKPIIVSPMNIFGFDYYGLSFIKNITDKWTNICGNVFPHLFLYVGVQHLILILVILGKFQIKNWKKSIIAIPVFCYNYGTGLLLTGPEDISRFFYYTFLITPILLIILLSSKITE